MKKRFITAIIMSILLLPLLLFANEEIFIVAAAIFSLVAIWEMLKMYEKKNEGNEEKKPLSFVTKTIIYTLTLFVHLSITLTWYLDKNNSSIVSLNVTSMYGITIFTSMIVIGMLMVFNKNIDSNYAGKIFMIINYAGLGFASLSIIRMFSKGLLIYIVIVASFTDIFAYLFGMKFGRHKMAKIISPKKSWEGSIAGTIFATAFGSVFFIFYNEWFSNGGTLFNNICQFENGILEIILAIFLTISVSVIGQIGDLVASKQKRDYEIKDFGMIFPGHGGVLDRFDSTVFIGLFLVVIFSFLRLILPL